MFSLIDYYLALLPPFLQFPARFCLTVTGMVYAASVLTSNVSQVDRLWTFLPTFYTAYYALLPLWPVEQANPWMNWILPYVPAMAAPSTRFDSRALLMLGLVMIWMFRLSYNTWRRGLFNLKDEDYRWAILRAQLHPILFQIINLTFISSMQNIILFLLGLPTYHAVAHFQSTPAVIDICLAALALVVLALEFTSDNQQYAFHAWKHFTLAQDAQHTSEVRKYDPADHWPGSRLDWSEEDAKRGYLCRGLFAYARHPNFACEQAFWWIITLMPLLSLPMSSLWSLSIQDTVTYLIPALVLTALFISSTLYTEAITAKKYPSYHKYQQQVPMFGPFVSGYKFRFGVLPRAWKRLTRAEAKKEL